MGVHATVLARFKKTVVQEDVPDPINGWNTAVFKKTISYKTIISIKSTWIIVMKSCYK